MAVLESGLPRIFATLLLKFLDRDLLIRARRQSLMPGVKETWYEAEETQEAGSCWNTEMGSS